jgi:hypothetical protein
VETFKGLEGAFTGKRPLKWKFKGFRGRLFWKAPSKVGGYFKKIIKKRYIFLFILDNLYIEAVHPKLYNLKPFFTHCIQQALYTTIHTYTTIH